MSVRKSLQGIENVEDVCVCVCVCVLEGVSLNAEIMVLHLLSLRIIVK